MPSPEVPVVSRVCVRRGEAWRAASFAPRIFPPRATAVRLMVAALLLLPVARLAPAQAAANPQQSVLGRALDLEGAGKCAEAIPLYREAIRIEDPVGAVLGLERCHSMSGGSEAMLPLLDTLLAAKPRDPTLRTVQLRTLVGLRRDAEAETAFTQWTSFSPREPAPYREYARLLLDQGRAAAADTVLQGAVRAIGGSRDLAAEFAQMQAALGLWLPSAKSWRQATETLPYLEQAATFALFAAPDSLRDSVRAVFSAPPLALSSRRILALLETRWRSAREGWLVLAPLAPTDSVVAAWLDFAREAEQNESWLTARDAYVAVRAHRPKDRSVALRAATAAMNGGEPASALALLQETAGSEGDDAAITLLQIRALGALGRAGEIERLLAERAAKLDDEGKRMAQRALAWAWIRGGDLPKAKAALAASGGTSEEDERVEGWLALYEGDLKTARSGLRRTDETSRDVVTAMALLSRTRAEFAPAVGDAFLALAKGDTAGAAQRFEATAAQVEDATPFLLGVAARLSVAVRDTAHAIGLWRRIVESHGDSPEAAESDLDWARVLRRRGDATGAVARLEHLILTYPQSALVPQARRELDLARGQVPPARGEASAGGVEPRAGGIGPSSGS